MSYKGNDKENDKSNAKIITAHGCVCKSEYTAHNVNIKNKCTLLGESDTWCVVEGKCGQSEQLTDGTTTYWDYCNRVRDSIFSPRYTYGKNYFYKQMIGSFIYAVLFVVLIPCLMYKYKWYTFLSVYMPNFDLIAASITYNGGPYNWEIFNELYPNHVENVYAYISSLAINCLSLLGVIYLVSSTVKQSKSVVKGFIVGLIMIIITYLIPNEIITSSQYYVSANIMTRFNLSPDTSGILYILVSIFGLFIAVLFILFEEYIILKQDGYIIKISKMISKNLWNKAWH